MGPRRVQTGGQDRVTWPWLADGMLPLPCHLRLEFLSRRREAPPGWVPNLNPKQGQLPLVASASGRGLASSARDFLSHKAAPELPGPASAPRGDSTCPCHLNAESPA